MAQDSTYNLPNIDRGSAARSKLNSIFEAVKTQNSGSSEPASPSAFMLWADSATDYLKIRNEANTNWNIIGKLNSEGLVLTSAGNPNGAITGLYEGQLLFDTSNNIPWYYSGSSTSWFTSNGTALSFNLPPFYHDVQTQWVSNSQIKILADSRCRSADNTKDVIFTSDYTVDMSNATPTSTTGGRTVAEASSTTYYLYVGLTSGNLPLAWLDTADLSAGGTPTNPAAYASGRRQVLVNGIQDEQLLIFNNSSSDIDYIGGSRFVGYGNNGSGSTNTRITRILTTLFNNGNAWTYADSATLGNSFTINKNGLYSFTDCAYSTGTSTAHGFSKNSTQLTTDFNLITRADVLMAGFANAGMPSSVSAQVWLLKGDVIRWHRGAADFFNDSAYTFMRVHRIG